MKPATSNRLPRIGNKTVKSAVKGRAATGVVQAQQARGKLRAAADIAQSGVEPVGDQLSDREPVSSEWAVRVEGSLDASGHWRRSYEIDMSDLALGRKPGRVQGYRGRPDMARSVIGALRNVFGSASPSRTVLYSRLHAMRHLWKSLDAFELENPGSSIDDLAALDGAPWLAFLFALGARGEKFAQRIHYACRETLNLALANAGCVQLIRTSPFSEKGRSENRKTQRPYSRAFERKMLEAFRSDRKDVEDRFAESYRVAESGDPTAEQRYVRNCRGGVVLPTIWKRPEILRFARDQLLATLPDKVAFRKRYGFKHDGIGCPPNAPVPVPLDGKAPKEFQRGLGLGLAALYRNFVPTERDIVPFMCELACHDGWNMETIRDIDRRDWYEGDPDDGVVYIFSRKMRAAGEIQMIESTTAPDSPYALITSALRNTELLHGWVVRRIKLLETMSATPAVTREVEQLREIVNRVWLLLRLDKTRVDAVTVDDNQFGEVASEILQRRGVDEDGKPGRWSGQRLRNRVAYDAFVDSDFDIESLCAVLGHADIGMSDRYLDHPDTDKYETEMIRARLDELAAGRGWPKPLPKLPTSRPSKSRLLITPEGRAWMQSFPEASRRLALQPDTRSTL